MCGSLSTRENGSLFSDTRTGMYAEQEDVGETVSESWLNQEYSRGFDSVQDTFEDDSTRIEFIDEVLDK